MTEQESQNSFDNYIEFVQAQIEKIDEYASLIKNGYVYPEKLNWLVSEYTRINLAIISQYEILLRERSLLEESYQKFWDSAFLKSRDKLNSSRVASKYASLSEIESQTRVDYAEEYGMWQSKMKELDSKIGFMKRILNAWDKEDNLLAVLSYNTRSEMKALKVEASVNASAKQADTDMKVKRKNNV